MESEALASTYHNLDIAHTTDYDMMKQRRHSANIEFRKLPKYYSSKLITRNQSGIRLADTGNVDSASQIEIGIAVDSG